jgi:hypothetical protein
MCLAVSPRLRDHRAVVDLVERLAELRGHAQGGARLPGARRAVEVEDAAALLRLETADAPDLLQLVANPDGAQAVEDLLLHPAMEDQVGELMAGFRVDKRAHFGFLLALPLPVAAAGVAVVGGDGRVGRQFFEFLDG